MPVYLTRTTQFRSKVEAFERRGLDNQASAKVTELAIITVSPRPLENTIRFANLSSELHSRLEGTQTRYDEIPRGVLRRFSGEAPFEAPTLIVEMKSGGEVLNGLGLFEVATSKQAIYGGQPPSLPTSRPSANSGSTSTKTSLYLVSESSACVLINPLRLSKCGPHDPSYGCGGSMPGKHHRCGNINWRGIPVPGGGAA